MKTDKKIFAIIGIATLLLIGGSVWAMSKMMSPVEEASVAEESTLIREDSPRKGQEAPITLVEFSDFECPACSASEPAVQQLLDAYPGVIQLVYRHFPLENIHFRARIGAYASEAAANQDKFWEMHAVLFEKQSEWTKADDVEATLVGYAEDLGLDVEKFQQDLKSDEVKKRVNQGITDGNIAKVNATPTFFINGQKVTGIGSPRFNEILQAELEKVDTSTMAPESTQEAEAMMEEGK